jgi:hypothetical protein
LKVQHLFSGTRHWGWLTPAVFGANRTFDKLG